MHRRGRQLGMAVAAIGLVLAACGDDAGTAAAGDSGDEERPGRDLGDPSDTLSDLAADEGPDGEDAAGDSGDAATDAASDASDASSDAGDTVGDSGSDAPNDVPVDAPSDAADTSADGGSDAVADGAGDSDADAPLVTPPPGSYQYDVVPLGGLSRVVAVALHPTEPIALVLESRDEVHRWSWELGTDVVLDPIPGSRHVDWQSVAWAPDGERALLLGSEPVEGGRAGVIFAFDETAWPAEGVPEAADVFSEYAGLPAANVYSALDWSDGPSPMVVSYNDLGGGNNTVALRRFDPDSGDMTFFGASASTGGCVDIARTANRFGDPGWLLTCNLSVLYATETGLPPATTVEWTTDLGGSNTGNANRVAAHASHEYALLIGWSGRRVFRFEREVMPSSADAPWFTMRDIWGVEFQPDGRRAVIYGGRMNISGSIIGTVLEYRHDIYTFAGITDVSIPSFGADPFVAPNNFSFTDAAWRYDCDGGVLVGGESSISGSSGMVVTFEIEGGTPCW